MALQIQSLRQTYELLLQEQENSIIVQSSDFKKGYAQAVNDFKRIMEALENKKEEDTIALNMRNNERAIADANDLEVHDGEEK